MTQLIFADSWSSYIVGALIGILSWFSFIISKKPLGTSTSYARGSARLGSICCGTTVFNWKYYQKYKPELEWQSMLVIGIVLGSFISSLLSGQFSLIFLPLTEFESILNQSCTFNSLIEAGESKWKVKLDYSRGSALELSLVFFSSGVE
ncbi:YeeE/YedE thiosulfate transporter family protein [Halanaerobium saccharolyticum]|uniref:YeeE/YedE thiosulfate transporter family protein n=1 Tax=Halanaerobium saccharolyticum TaxID=43595 RepID=UPI00105D98D0|nr:YeeE/YedE thiosulfate transporter family protein [Halanaerobium saccharolyticum]